MLSLELNGRFKIDLYTVSEVLKAIIVIARHSADNLSKCKQQSLRISHPSHRYSTAGYITLADRETSKIRRK